MKPIRTEGQLSFHIVSLAERLGWRVFTIRDSKAAKLASRTGPGFPDLVMIRTGSVLIVELKTWKTRCRFQPGQREWLEAWRATGADVRIWTERDWASGEIQERLAEREWQET